MVKQTNDKIVREISKLNENESFAVLEYISQILSAKNFSIQTDKFNNDDLIASLSEKRENRRARQVVEWEKTRRKNFLKAA
ncbi:MAG: hypothetical protein ACR2GD_12525 [Pyrinomonadaceae bacterium]